MTRLNWRWLLALSSIPSFALLLLYGLAPESPRYLCAKGKTVEAQRILEKMATINRKSLPPGVLVSDGSTKQNEGSASSQDTLPLFRKLARKLKSAFSSFFMLFSPKLIRTTLLLWVLFFANAFSYYGIVLLTSKLSSQENKCGSTVLHTDKSKDNSLYLDVFITSLAGTWCCSFDFLHLFHLICCGLFFCLLTILNLIFQRFLDLSCQQ